jgi:hypothetical protein
MEPVILCYYGTFSRYWRILYVVQYSEFLATEPEVRVRSLALPYFLRGSGSGTGPTQPREYN